MKIRYLFLITFVAVALGITASAQTRFTSAYSNLGTDCKTLRGTRGTDNAFLCNGVGGYRIRVYYSAATMQINAELKRTDDSFPLAILDLDFDFSRSRVEWRMANGKPFAVILRVPEYGEPTDSGAYFGKVIGGRLIVRGLKGYDISEEVDAASRDANAKARELADKAYVRAQDRP